MKAVEFSIHKEMCKVFKSAAKLPFKTHALRDFEKCGFLVGDGRTIKLFGMTGNYFGIAKVAEYTGERFDFCLPLSTMRQIAKVTKSTPEWLRLKIWDGGLTISTKEGEIFDAKIAEHPEVDFMLDYTKDGYKPHQRIEIGRERLLAEFNDALNITQGKWGRVYRFKLEHGKEMSLNADFMTNIVNFLCEATKSEMVGIVFYSHVKRDFGNQIRLCEIHVGDGGFGLLMGVVV